MKIKYFTIKIADGNINACSSKLDTENNTCILSNLQTASLSRLINRLFADETHFQQPVRMETDSRFGETGSLYNFGPADRTFPPDEVKNRPSCGSSIKSLGVAPSVFMQ